MNTSHRYGQVLCAWLIGSGLALCLGCAGAPRPERPALPRCAKDAGPPITVSVRVEARTEGQAISRELRRGDAVRSGEGVAFSLQSDAPAHLYLIHRGPRGKRGRLFQDPLDHPQPARETLRVPAGEEWLTLDDETGPESFVIAVSRRPFWEAAPGICQVLGLRCKPATQRGDDDEPPPPPPGSEPDERGPISGTEELLLRTDSCGLGLLRFPLRHVP